MAVAPGLNVLDSTAMIRFGLLWLLPAFLMLMVIVAAMRAVPTPTAARAAYM